MPNKRAVESLQMRFAPRSFCLWAVAGIAALACALAAVGLTSITAPGAIAESGSSRPGSSRPGSDQPEQTYEGIVTDTRCGAKHSAAIGKSATDCSRACVHGGAEFALVDGETVYRLVGEVMALKRVAGQRVKVVGTLSGDKLTVTSVAAL